MLGSENSAAHPGRHFEEWPIGKARALGARSCRFESCFLDRLTGEGVVMELKVGLRLERKSKQDKTSNLCEVVELYPDGKARIQHLERGKRQMVVEQKTLLNSWRVPSTQVDPVALLEAKTNALELRVKDVEDRYDRLCKALGGA